MKTFLKTGFLMFMCIIILSSCEKALDNSIPDGTPRREAYNTKIKEILVNDSVWVTPFYNNGATKFRAGFLFAKDGTCKIYSTVRNPVTLMQQLTAAVEANPTTANKNELAALTTAFGTFINDDAQLRSVLLQAGNVTFKNRVEKFVIVTPTAPLSNVIVTVADNTYGVYGDFNSSFTIYNTSVLSELKQKNLFDFDFLINAYNRDSLSLEGYYSQNSNRFVKIKPVAVPNILQHVNATNILVTALAFNTELRVNGVAISTEGNTYLKTRFADGHDNLNKCIVFKSVAGQAVDPLFAGINAIKAIDVPFIAGSAKPAAGTVIAKFTGYDIANKGSLATGKTVELIVK
jgi:hypothetical protein